MKSRYDYDSPDGNYEPVNVDATICPRCGSENIGECDLPGFLECGDCYFSFDPNVTNTDILEQKVDNDEDAIHEELANKF